MTLALVVEDEESFSDALSYLLRKEGFEVAICPAGPDALDTFDRNGADWVLPDLMLPGPPGTEVCRSLRNGRMCRLSAKDTEVNKAVGLELGADDYVTKPFSWRELAARIRAVLRRHGKPRNCRRQRSRRPRCAWTSTGTWSPWAASRSSCRPRRLPRHCVRHGRARYA